MGAGARYGAPLPISILPRPHKIVQFHAFLYGPCFHWRYTSMPDSPPQLRRSPMLVRTPSITPHPEFTVVLTQTAEEVPRVWPELSLQSQRQLAQQIGRLLLRLSPPRAVQRSLHC